MELSTLSISLAVLRHAIVRAEYVVMYYLLLSIDLVFFVAVLFCLCCLLGFYFYKGPSGAGITN